MQVAPEQARAQDVLALGDGPTLAIVDLVAVARGGRAVGLAPAARERVALARAVVDGIVETGRVLYGINTGFGDLSRVVIPGDELVELQHNLVASHAAGAGAPLERDAVRATMLLLANSLAKGHSGVRPVVVDTILALLNEDVVPVVPSRGSVGASGDLAPLAHVALALGGEGRVWHRGVEKDAATALRDAGIEPLELQSKEGLALVNGTHVMAGLGALLVADARRLVAAAEAAAALSFDVMLGIEEVLDARIHELRRRPRQADVALRLRAALAGSGLRGESSGQVQDPYSLRCIPQVFGATIEALDYVEQAVALELDAVSDNPLCFPDSGDVVSGGNFHGQPLGLPLDTLAIAVAEIAAFSERRTFRLLSTPEGTELPPFLSSKPGVRSGLMIVQYLAASLVAENQVLAHPAGVAVVPTSAGQEDFNSFGATAALKACDVLANARTIVAVELLCAAQALDFHRPRRTSDVLEGVYARVRELSPTQHGDRSLTEDIAALAAAIEGGRFD